MTTRRTVLQGLGALAAPIPLHPAPAFIAPDGSGAGGGMLSQGYIVRRGGRVVRRAEGLALTPDGFKPFDLHRPFRVASVSKMITTHGFLSLVEQGRIDLDADVSDALGWRLRHPAHPDIAITARMLLSHTSGIRNGADFPIPFTVSLQDSLQRAATAPDLGGWFAPPQETPGRWFAYSDANFAVIAQIMERLTGQRFDRFMHDAVFAPAGLDIGYNWSGVSAGKRAHVAAGGRWIDGAWKAQVDANPPPAPEIALYRAPGDTTSGIADFKSGENGFAFAPHGGLRLSLADMDALARRLMRSPRTAMQARPVWIYTPETPNGATENGFFQAYALGMHAPTGHTGDSYFGASSSAWRGHFGDAYGWMTGLWWNAKQNVTLVYALNGMPETGRTPSPRSALTAAEQDLIDRALREVGVS